MAVKDRDIIKLIGSKNSKITIENGLPHRNEGNNGELTIRNIGNSGTYLFVKVNNLWHSIKLNRGLDES